MDTAMTAAMAYRRYSTFPHAPQGSLVFSDLDSVLT